MEAADQVISIFAVSEGYADGIELTDIARYEQGLIPYVNSRYRDLSDIINSGKKLDKLCIESKLTTVLHAVCEGGEYKFKVHADNSTAKTPMGAFEADEIDNDITKVLDALKEY